MNIWHLIPSTNLGGVEVFAKSLIENFPVEADHTVFSLDNIDGFIANDISVVANLKKINNTKSIKNIFFIIRLLRKQKPHSIIIHVFNISILNFIFISKIFNIKKIIIVVGNPPLRKYLLKLKVFLTFLRIFNIPIVFCSKYTLNEFKKFFKLPKRSLSIRHGCDLIKANLIKNKSSQLFKKDRKLSITMVARLDTIKDQETLIKAFLRINNARWELNLIGDGDQKNYLQNLVKNLYGKEKIKFWGFRKNVLEILSNTDIFAFSTTKDEGFGIALIEAISLGIPIIASDVPACREVLMEGKGGILVKAGNIDEWEEKLSVLMESETKRILLGKRSREISSFYDIQKVSKEYWNLLKMI